MTIRIIVGLAHALLCRVHLLFLLLNRRFQDVEDRARAPTFVLLRIVRLPRNIIDGR